MAELKITSTKSADGLTLILSGSIIEGSSARLLKAMTGKGPIQIDFEDVTIVSSAGVREWNQLVVPAWKGRRVRLLSLHANVVETLNLVPDFAAGAEVHSLYVPFRCGDCRKAKEIKARVEEVAFLQEPRCDACDIAMEMAHDPEDYFRFQKPDDSPA